MTDTTHTPTQDANYLRSLAINARVHGATMTADEMVAMADRIATLRASHDGLVEALRLTDQLFSDMFLARMPETESIRCRAVRDRVRAALASEVTHG